jgi:hypothetical protein
MTESPDSLGSGVALEDRLPIRCHGSSEAARPQDNEDTLRAILSLDEHHHSELNDEDPALAQEFARLESRLNLVMELVGQLLVRQLALPEPVPLRLFAGGVEWETARPPSPGQPAMIELYVCRRLPRPLWLPATMVGAPRPGWSAARFAELGEAVQEQLEMLIFRHHRRQVAAVRRGAP